MDKHNQTEYDWDDQYYGTGPTQPPKNKGGLVALMLILIIFLCGIITVLGVLNIRLFKQLQVNRQKEEQISIAFTTESTMPVEETAPIAAVSETEPHSAAFSSMDIQHTPQSMDNIPVEGGISLQDIYLQNIPSVVSISASGTAAIPPVPA